MHLVTLVKAPLRAARSAYRGVRDALGLTPIPTDVTTTGTQRPPEPAPEAVAPPAAPAPSEAAPTLAPPTPAPNREPVTVYVEPTPNPDARKFLCSVPVVAKGSVAFDDAESAAGNPLAAALFELGGVRTVFAVRDFVTITRESHADWTELEARVVDVLEHHLGA